MQEYKGKSDAISCLLKNKLFAHRKHDKSRKKHLQRKNENRFSRTKLVNKIE